ncbi:MAG: hypothetical protein Q7R81_00810 [Candidatus Peregrinibacteria bacterium]|nr:hypothetical protein [Candidatus Peregrinibacteria bacterium]
MPTCDACGQEIVECTVCGGKICVVGCPDRADDGCTCNESEEPELLEGDADEV